MIGSRKADCVQAAVGVDALAVAAYKFDSIASRGVGEGHEGVRLLLAKAANVEQRIREAKDGVVISLSINRHVHLQPIGSQGLAEQIIFVSGLCGFLRSGALHEVSLLAGDAGEAKVS